MAMHKTPTVFNLMLTLRFVINWSMCDLVPIQPKPSATPSANAYKRGTSSCRPLDKRALRSVPGQQMATNCPAPLNEARIASRSDTGSLICGKAKPSSNRFSILRRLVIRHSRSGFNAPIIVPAATGPNVPILVALALPTHHSACSSIHDAVITVLRGLAI